MGKEVVVLRYGHRIVRDYRVTSHCALVARAFGAKKIIICGAPDLGLKKSVDKITENWGGNFKAEFASSWRDEIRKYRKKGFFAVHATMYGKPLPEKIEQIQKKARVLLVVGSQKVEARVYELVDVNVSITLQPHSEIAAIAVFLDRFFGGAFLTKRFPKSKVFIKPQERGKSVLREMQAKK